MKPGDRIGPYEVLELVGSGSMGDVHRARDTKLNRDVAIKSLPDQFVDDEARIGRFTREAQTLAALNHPNIAQIYGIVEGGGSSRVHALVMELVEGDDLSCRIAGGAMPIGEALAIAKQIADALEAAHEQGIVHRDLKPANVKVRADGRVKVLDFGLAKATEAGPGDAASDRLTNSPTMTSPAVTAMGVVLGTAAYMSPEQAKGAAVDKRTDIWAFGVVFFEMLTGQSPFHAPTTAEILAQVLTREPDFARLPASTPLPIRQLLRRCLERDPKRRLHDIADGRLVIDDVRLDAASAERRARSGGRTGLGAPSRRSVLAWLGVVALAVSGGGAIGHLSAGPRTATPSPLRLAIHLGNNQEISTESNAILAFSPDGDTLVYPGSEDGRQSLFRRRLGERTAEPIPGTEGGASPFFSPDGRWLGFVAHSRLRKVPVEGGRPFPLAEAEGSGGAEWLADGTIVFVPIYSEGLFRVSAEGGTRERLTTPDHRSGELGHWYPRALPGGRRVIFTAFRTPVDRSRIGVLDLATREVRWIVDGGFYGRYVPSGHLIYAKEQRLYALPFDPATATVLGPAVAVLDDLRTSQTGGYAQAAVSSQGALAYVTDSLGNPLRELMWIDRSGYAVPATRERRHFLTVSLSPDNERAAVTIQDESRDLWVLSLTRATLSRLTTGERTEYDPKWTRDGRELLYVVDRPPFELWRIAIGSVDAGHPLWKEPSEADTNAIAVSPDGRTIAYNVAEIGTGANIYSRPIDGSAPPAPFRRTRADERSASFSPDGRYVVFQSDQTGRPEIYVAPYPGPGDEAQVSADGGTEPLWAADGEIFYRKDNEFRVVSTRLTPRLSFGEPKALFTYSITLSNADTSRLYDVTRDGSRILAITIPPESRPRQIELVTNWVDDLRRVVPVSER